MAKLRNDQLQGALQPLAPVYLISGDETLLVQEASDSVRQAAIIAGFSERERYHADKSFDWRQILSAANSLSLFNDRKIIEISLENKPNAEAGKLLIEYLAQPSEDTLLLITSPKLDANTQRAKWVKSIEQKGHWLPIWPINTAQLPRWISQRCQQTGLQADSSVIDLLASRTEGNLLAAQQEIEKLRLLANDQPLTRELISSVVADSARYDVFDLIDKALLGDSRGAVKTLNGLKSEGTDAITVLWALARELRTLVSVAQGIEQGQSPSWAMKQAKVWDKRQGLTQQAINRLDRRQLNLMLRQSSGIDKAIKGLRKVDYWNELMELTLNLSGVRSIHPSNQRLSLQ